jgi:hypothetical protein
MKRRFLPPAILLALVMLVSGALAAAPGSLRVTPGEPSSRTCATPNPTRSEIGQARLAMEDFARQFGAQTIGGQIKVAWHVIYSGSEGNIPQSQIDAQIDELNKAYSGYYGGFNTGYTFVLASVDRTENAEWFTMRMGSGSERQAKRALAVDVPHRLNIYSCKPGALGWAVFPQSLREDNPQHGIVIHYGSVPGGYLSAYNLGGTADHEVGHYLGLYHTFQGGCGPPNDYVDDTPFEMTANFGCPASRNTCADSGDDPIHNYMDYSDDSCYTQFTAGQDARMDALVSVYRPSLLNAARLTLGVGGGNPPPGGNSGREEQVISFRGAFPNPFRAQTVLRFYLPRKDRVSLKIFNVAGRLVETLADGEMSAGEQSLALSAGTLPAGMYFAALRVGGNLFSRSVLLIR